MADGALTPESVQHRGILTVCAMVATLMQALDSTIANVSLPYMQGSLAASYEEVTWVLTSYIVAAAIMTAPVGWLSTRFSERRVFLVSLAGFTIASMLCGMATSLDEMVLFRFAQGLFGAALVPISQSVMLNIYPLERRGQAMAIWGMGVMVGPILGPTLGGYLTEHYDWRYVFFVNLPFGVLAILGVLFSMPGGKAQRSLTFDWFGFVFLAAALTGLQLMLDRGETKDWFASTEVLTEAIVALFGFYVFIVHLCTAERPFISPHMFADRNFAMALVIMFLVGMVLLATSALLAPWLQELGNYPVETAGLLLAPRGFGTMAAMLIAGRLTNRIDARIIMFGGTLMLIATFWRMTGWTPAVSEFEIIWTSILQGFGIGFVFIPLNVVAFATLPGELRTQGTAMWSLIRNVGSAVGISIFEALITTNAQVEHAALSQFISPLNRALGWSDITAHALHTPQGIAMLGQMVDQQSQIIAYNDDFWLMMVIAVPILILLPFMRKPRAGGGDSGHAAVMD
ncbi:MAG TPA: DHA2 family efflux MFS transporter permease subunit [Acetobacteraceae bacterium]|nr:DHA2 family efflux MFS transporter permease subunit [Acetobacteraceae bacterium]